MLYCNNISFKSGYVTTNKSVLGHKVKNEIVKQFNCDDNFVPKKPEVNYFVLAGGKGSRFASYTKALEPLYGEQNKITMHFPIENEEKILPFRIIDFALEMGKEFLDKDKKYTCLENEIPTGNMGDVIKFYQRHPESIKPTIICCGDNIWGIPSSELKDTVDDALNNNISLLLFGSKQKITDNNMGFGIIKFDSHDNNGIRKVLGLLDTSSPDIVKKYHDTCLTKDGYAISYPGMLYIDKENLRWILSRIESEPDFIRKDGNSNGEKYDYISAVKRIMNERPKSKIAVKPVSDWVDTGTPERYLDFLTSIKKENLINFDKEQAKIIINGLKKQIDTQNKIIYLGKTNKKFNTDLKIGKDIYKIKSGLPSFGSKVISESDIGNKKLSKSQLDFIDKFEEMSEKEKKKFKLSSGMTADVFLIKKYNFVIKMIKNNFDKYISEFLNESLFKEFESLKILNNKRINNTQKGISYLETKKGSKFLITEFHKGEAVNLDNEKFRKEGFSKILKSLCDLDKISIINFDWNPNNIIFDGKKFTLLDFQWALPFSDAKTNPNIIINNIEPVSNMTTFETSTIAPYIHQTRDYEILHKYLQDKAKFCKKNIKNKPDKMQRFEFLRSVVYKNPTPKILKAEMYRLEFLYNNMKKNYYLAPDLEGNKDKSLYKIFEKNAKKSADKLSSIDTKDSNPLISEYLSFMKEYGKSLQNIA